MLAFTFKVAHLYQLTLVPNVTRQIAAVLFKRTFWVLLLATAEGRNLARKSRTLLHFPCPASFPQFPRQFCCLNFITSPAHTEWAAFCILLLMRIAEKLKVTPKAVEIGSEQQLVLKVVAQCSPSPARWKPESSFLRLRVCWQRASFSSITRNVSAHFPLNLKEGGSNVCF